MNIWECPNVWGCMNMGGIWIPLSLTTPMPASKVGTSYLKLNVLPYYLLTWSLTNTRGAAFGSGT